VNPDKSNTKISIGPSRHILFLLLFFCRKFCIDDLFVVVFGKSKSSMPFGHKS
jgi:hypothetical protein